MDSARFMASSLSSLFDNLAEGIHKIKWKHGFDNKNAKRVELNAKIVSALLNTKTLKMVQYYTTVYVAIRMTRKSLIKT